MMLIQTTNATVISPFTLFSGGMLTIRDISQTSIIPIKQLLKPKTITALHHVVLRHLTFYRNINSTKHTEDLL